MKSWRAPSNFFVRERRHSQLPEDTFPNRAEKEGRIDSTVGPVSDSSGTSGSARENSGAKEVAAASEISPTGEAVSPVRSKPKVKRPLRMHAIKCKCGEILGRNMKSCPGCGKEMEVLLDELRQDFHRINFTRVPKKEK